MYDVARIEELRTLVADEKVKVLKLHEGFVNPYFKKKAKFLADDADMISVMFLGSNLEAGLPEWIEGMNLDSVQSTISVMLTQPREYLEEIWKKYGANVETAG